jgi:hypothetical protein
MYCSMLFSYVLIYTETSYFTIVVLIMLIICAILHGNLKQSIFLYKQNKLFYNCCVDYANYMCYSPWEPLIQVVCRTVSYNGVINTFV